MTHEELYLDMEIGQNMIGGFPLQYEEKKAWAWTKKK